MAGRHRNDFAVELVGPTCVVFEHFGHLGHFTTAVPNGLSCGNGLQLCQGFQVHPNFASDVLHHATPSRVAECAPGQLAGGRRRSRLGDQICLGAGVLDEEFASCRVDQFDELPIAADQGTANVGAHRP